MRRAVLGCVLVLSGCCMGGGAPSGPTPVGRCDAIATASTCVDQQSTGDLGQTLGAALAISAVCGVIGGNYADNQGCPTENVAASCTPDPESGYVTHYYTTGGTPFTAESAQAACTAPTAPPPPTTTTPEPVAGATAHLVSCNFASVGECTETDLNDPGITASLEQTRGFCVSPGEFAEAACALEGAVGACRPMAGQRVVYAAPYTAESAQEACTGQSGTWEAAPVAAWASAGAAPEEAPTAEP